jgi:hypothetical protein
LLKKNKNTEQVSIDTNELSSTSLSEVKLSIEQNNCLISLSEIIENDTVSNKQQAILESELESELNDIMQSLIMDEKSLSKKELIIMNSKIIYHIKNQTTVHLPYSQTYHARSCSFIFRIRYKTILTIEN